jgi:hypothetical protein
VAGQDETAPVHFFLNLSSSSKEWVVNSTICYYEDGPSNELEAPHHLKPMIVQIICHCANWGSEKWKGNAVNLIHL